MTIVQAWQHIYSNVEAEQSPKGRGGFQTLYYTISGLTPDEISEMEGRLLYFPSKTVEPVKRLFFTTSTGKSVVAQIVVLPEPDQFGRKGRYLAHALAFTPQALAQFEADPFRVFRHFSFITTVAGAMAQGDSRTGNIPPVSLKLPTNSAHDFKMAEAWPAPELKRLALLALRVEQQAQNRQAIIFAGESEQVENALEAAFLVVPCSIRPRCSFDTYFYRCNLVATYFWTIGLPEAPVSIKFALVEGGSHRVQGTVPSQPETAYERWVFKAIEARELERVARYRDNAFAAGEWLDGREYSVSLLEVTSPELITDVFKSNPQAVQASLRRRVGEQIPAALVDRAADHIYEQTTEIALYRKLRQGFEVLQLLDALYQSYSAQNFETPPKDEINALKTLLEETDHKLLRLFLACWHNARKDLPQELEQASETIYRHFSEIALQLELVKPLSLLLPGRGDAFLDLYLAAGVDDLIDLVEALMNVDEIACLSRLADDVAKLSPKELKYLANLIDDHSDTPRTFRVAVDEAIAALPPKKGVKEVLQAAWRRLPGGG